MTFATKSDTSGLAMIMVEENLDFIAVLSQRILVIQKGSIKPGS
jgi:branched-chain amino acid transport system ATP-binding protein